MCLLLKKRKTTKSPRHSVYFSMYDLVRGASLSKDANLGDTASRSGVERRRGTIRLHSARTLSMVANSEDLWLETPHKNQYRWDLNERDHFLLAGCAKFIRCWWHTSPQVGTSDTFFPVPYNVGETSYIMLYSNSHDDIYSHAPSHGDVAIDKLPMIFYTLQLIIFLSGAISISGYPMGFKSSIKGCEPGDTQMMMSFQPPQGGRI